MEFFDIGLKLALAICFVGLVSRIGKWGGRPSTEGRAALCLSGIIKGVRAFIVDVLLLGRSIRTSPMRWAAHMLVFVGFMGLLLFHALDETITAYFFPAYEPTLDPWQFLRNLFGLMTLVGLALMIYRRAVSKRLREISRFQDWAALLVVTCIILSGFFLEATKIISPAAFTRMTDEYFIPETGSDMTALQAYWAKEYGVVFPKTLPMDEATLELGKQLDEDSCADCHSNTSSAFVSRPLATSFGPLASALNISGAEHVFWYLHIIFCFIGLAALPFGKFFHPLSSSANLTVRQGRRDGEPEPSSVLRGLGLDACTRCGECALRCSVAPSHAVLGNADILPSEKLASLARFEGGEMTAQELFGFAEGSRICTECLRCTDICPAGINLQDLWLSSKPEVAKSEPNPDQAIRAMEPEMWLAEYGGKDLEPEVNGLADNAESFWACVQCTTCTSVCPVVAVSEDPSRDLDLAPQQIMNLLRMGLKDETLGARMVWSCTTCYKCQEHCPQNIKVADILYELRNTVAARKRADVIGEEGEQ